MYQLAQVQKETGTRASELYGVDDLVERLIGMPCDWINLQFDNAVTWFGRYIEAKLSIVNKKTGEQEYSLDQLLKTRQELTQDALQRALEKGRVVKR